MTRLPDKPGLYSAANGIMVVRRASLRTLSTHDMLDWDGGAFDPEAAAIASERCRFVVKRRDEGTPA